MIQATEEYVATTAEAPETPPRRKPKAGRSGPLEPVLGLLSSLNLAMALILLLGLLTLLGTLAQVELGLYDAQKKYFESWGLIERFGPVPVPLPGGRLVMTLLTANILVGGLMRLRKGWRVAGVMVTHVGIVMLIVSGAVKTWLAEDGHTTLFEGESASYFQSYYKSELSISRLLDEGQVEEFTLPEAAFRHATGDEPAVLSDPALPFDLEVRHFASNAFARRKGPMFDVPTPVVGGVFLQSLPRDKNAEGNSAGAHVTVVDKATGERTSDLVWSLSLPGLDTGPFTVRTAGGPWLVDLRKERYAMPFEVRLDDFQKREHPRTNMPSWFSSDVTLDEAGATREVQISMNKPLRDQGLVVFQASWGPKDAGPRTPLFSSFAVVRNPSDQWPLWSCIIIGAGMLFHFGTKLKKHVGKELQRARA